MLTRILGTLAEAIDREDGVNDGLPCDQTVGEALIKNRPAQGWKDMDQLREMARLAGPVWQAKFAALEPYITPHAWVDKHVIRPNAVAGPYTSYTNWVDIKRAHQTYDPALPGICAPDFERIPVDPLGRIVGRAPVNFAWARHRRPVLLALLAGLEGYYLDEGKATVEDNMALSGDYIGQVRNLSILLDPGPDWSYGSGGWCCELMADQIFASTSEVRTWQDFDALCDSLVVPGPMTWWEPKRSILKANFNPNSDLNKFNPNLSMWRMVDKSDLLVYSTEFSLLPVHDHEVTSVGRVLDRLGRLLAMRTARAWVSGPSVVRLSTQKEFVCADLGDLDVAGDETSPRLPGAALYLSLNGGSSKAWGHTLPGAGPNGVALQTYPEPCVRPVAGGPLLLNPADYDGSVQLATLETENAANHGGDLKMLARFDASFDLGVADADPTLIGPASRNQTDTEQASAAGLAQGLLPDASMFPGVKAVTLYPDGAYSEKDRCPAYLDRLNANGLGGVIAFWIKPAFLLGKTTDDGLPGNQNYSYRERQFVKWSNYSSGPGGGTPSSTSPDQFFLLGMVHNNCQGAIVDPYLVCFFETNHDDSDYGGTPGNPSKRTHMFGTQPRDRSFHRWEHLAMSYDFQSLTNDDCGELLADAGTVGTNGSTDTSDVGGRDLYLGGWTNDPAAASDITAADLFGPHLIALGRRGLIQEGPVQPPFPQAIVPEQFGSGADSTIDEFGIWDLGSPPPLVLAQGLAQDRYREGRYYKESAYGIPFFGSKAARYYSGKIDLKVPRRIRAVAWTQVVPRGLKSPLPLTGRAGVDGDPSTPDGLISLELSNLTGNAYLKDTANKPINRRFLDGVLSRVDRVVSAPFRLHAVFQPNLDNALSTPILDPLTLDDLSVLHDPPEGPPILSWRDGDTE